MWIGDVHLRDLVLVVDKHALGVGLLLGLVIATIDLACVVILSVLASIANHRGCVHHELWIHHGHVLLAAILVVHLIPVLDLTGVLLVNSIWLGDVHVRHGVSCLLVHLLGMHG